MTVTEMKLYDYTDYREFLKDFYAREKGRSRGFSYRSFARRAQLASPNYLKLVIDGKRPVTEKNCASFIRGLRLDKKESDYFRTLVAYQSTRAGTEKKALFDRILSLRSKAMKNVQVIDARSTAILEAWYHWVIREMALLVDFRDDPVWIAQRLRGKITPQQAKESLELLLEVGAVIKTEDGRWKPGQTMVSTSDGIASEMVRYLHRQFLEHATERVLDEPFENRGFGGLTIALPRARIPELKKRISEMRRELHQEFAQEEGVEEIYHVMMGFFPMTWTVRSRGDKE